MSPDINESRLKQTRIDKYTEVVHEDKGFDHTG